MCYCVYLIGYNKPKCVTSTKILYWNHVFGTDFSKQDEGHSELTQIITLVIFVAIFVHDIPNSTPIVVKNFHLYVFIYNRGGQAP